MADKTSKARVNLAFNLNDPDQEKAYRYLTASERNKTAAITDLIIAHIASGKEEKHNGREDDLVEIKKSLSEILERLDGIKAVRTAEDDPKVEMMKTDDVHNDGDEISDDAFESMMNIFG